MKARLLVIEYEGPLSGLQELDDPEVPACVVCGCTDNAACPGGCAWVDVGDPVDVCSQCIEEYARQKKATAKKRRSR